MDIIAAFRPATIEVELAGFLYDIPPLPADIWIEAVLAQDALAVVPGLLGEEDEADVLARLTDGEFEGREVLIAARHALEAAAGRPWWEAEYLILGAASAWDVVGGEFVLRGIDLSRLSIGAFCNAVYRLATENLERDKKLRFDADLQRIPADAGDEDLPADDALEQGFAAALAEAQRLAS